MEVEGTVESEPHKRGQDEEVGEVASEKPTVEDDMTRSKGVRRDFYFDEEKDGEVWKRYAGGYDGDFVGPCHVASSVEADEESGDCENETKSSEEVDAAKLLNPMAVFRFGEVEDEVHYNKCSDGHGELAQESPVYH